MEKYKILFEGKLRKELADISLEDHLTRLKFPEKVISLAKAKRRMTLKSNLSLEQAKSYRSTLYRRGLESEIGLQLDRGCLDAGLVYDAQPSTQVFGPVLVFDEKQVAPSVVSLPKEHQITRSQGRVAYVSKSLSTFWNPSLLFIACACVALFLELYVVRILSEYFSLDISATVTGVVLLVVGVLFLPKIFQPLSIVEVVDKTEGSSVLVLENECFFPGKKEFSFYQDTGQKIATLTRSSSSACLTRISGDTIFTWDLKSKVPESADDSLRNLQDHILSDTVLDELMGYFYNVKKLLTLFIPKSSPETVIWLSSNASPIFDEENTLVAMLYREPYPAVKTRAVDESDVLLVAFCLCITKSHLI